MLAAYASSLNWDDPLSGLVVGERPDPEPPAGWTTVTVKAASINHHDIWSLRGSGLKAESLPMILGCDAAGLDADGNEVVIYGLISEGDWPGDETTNPRRSLLSEKYQGTLAEKVMVPTRNLIPKPAGVSFEEAACLGTAWLTAYRMLFTQSGLKPGDTVLVQGAAGGVSTALMALGRAAGFKVVVTGRTEEKRAKALELGAHEVFESNQRLPYKVDAVMETVGKATWAHSIRSLRPGGTLVTSGVTSGADLDDALLTNIFFLALRIQGSTMGTREEFTQLLKFMDIKGLQPVIDRVIPLADARQGFEAMNTGDIVGKIVLSAN